MKPDRPFVLDHNALYQICLDEKFYRVVPLFHYLKGPGTAAARQVVTRYAGGKGCSGCGGDLKEIMAPVMTAMVTHMRQLIQEGDQSLLDPFLEYLRGRLGYRATPLVVYYKDGDGPPHKIEL